MSDQDAPRYRRFSAYLRETYGGRVRKLSLDAGFSCPNRDGSLSHDGCVFCEPEAFSPYAGKRIPLKEQIAQGIRPQNKNNAGGYIAYFQAYTNTYGTLPYLRKTYDTIRGIPQIKILAVGTRPDCIDEEKLALLAEYLDEYDVWIEYGLQSIHDTTLTTINRGHAAEDFFKAVERTQKFPGIRIGAHLILGLPGETLAMEAETARAVAATAIDAVKLHPLHIVKGTALEHTFNAGEYIPLTWQEYVERVVQVLQFLPPQMVIERLTADCPAEQLVAPLWLGDKHAIIHAIEERLKELDTRQGASYKDTVKVREDSNVSLLP